MAGSRYCGSQNLKGNEIIHEENVDHFAFRSNVNRLVRAGDEISSSQRSQVSFGYMWSADQILGPAGHWHPHVMVFAPNYDNTMLGGNEVGGHLPSLSDDAGTPFSVVVIPVDEKLAIKATP